MLDPRLVEIDFLMDLARDGMLRVRSTGEASTSGGGYGTRGAPRLYGLDPLDFRGLVLDLVLRGYVASGAHYMVGNEIDEEDLRVERFKLTRTLTVGQPFDLVITHAGHVRLWELRDQLLRDPDVEPLGLFSKAAWERDFAVRLRWASSTAPLSVILLDLDDFGKVNKEIGHAVGDEVLRTTFAILRNFVGARGRVYRCGGEEVGILLHDTALKEASEVAEALREQIETSVVDAVAKLTRPQTASIGVTTVIARADPALVFDRVDALMRAAKVAGKNRVHSASFASAQ